MAKAFMIRNNEDHTLSAICSRCIENYDSASATAVEAGGDLCCRECGITFACIEAHEKHRLSGEQCEVVGGEVVSALKTVSAEKLKLQAALKNLLIAIYQTGPLGRAVSEAKRVLKETE